jgi:Coenzyme PQQ synthesis protein D (PqqD)
MHDPADVVFRFAPDVESSVVAGEVCLFEPQLSQLYILNDTAGAVWQLAGAGAGFETTVTHLVERFDIEPAVVREDVRATLAQLARSRLLVRRT